MAGEHAGGHRIPASACQPQRACTCIAPPKDGWQVHCFGPARVPDGCVPGGEGCSTVRALYSARKSSACTSFACTQLCTVLMPCLQESSAAAASSMHLASDLSFQPTEGLPRPLTTSSKCQPEVSSSLKVQKGVGCMCSGLVGFETKSSMAARWCATKIHRFQAHLPAL